jgi:hypothetical protein
MRKVFACLFALVGIVLLLGTGVLSFRVLNAPTRLVGPAVSAGNRTEAWAAAVAEEEAEDIAKMMEELDF